MSKRRLTKQQALRIEEKLASIDKASLRLGLVVTHYGTEVELIDITSPDSDITTNKDLPKYRCHLRANLPTVVCGDRVYWQIAKDDDIGVIESLQERRSLLQRPRPYEDPKPVAANIDCIFLVISPQPIPFTSLIDRYLIAAENADIPIEIIVNKTDLLDSDASINKEISDIIALYQHLNYSVRQCNKHNADQLWEASANKTSILVGQSGVGKSSLINTLIQSDAAEIGEISSFNDKGRHTTTTSQLYRLENGGKIIDSPGIREFGLWHLTVDDIIYGLPEFRQYALHCQFRDCEHGVSKGCAVQNAIENGSISASRVSSFHTILNALKEA